MSEPKKKQAPDEQRSSTPKKFTGRVIPGPEPVAPSDRKPVKVVGPDRLTTEEMKERFASNLDRLVGLLGMTRKQAAQEIGIPYKLMRRLVSEGVSRTDERSEEDVTKIATFFALPEVDDFWRADLVSLVLNPDGPGAFVKQFRSRLMAERERRLAEVRLGVQDELGLLSRALGLSDGPPIALTGPYADQLATILASSKAESFKQIIAVFHELVTLLSKEPDDGRDAVKPAGRA